MNLEDEAFVEVADLSLDEWLKLVFDPPKGKIFTNTCFPTEKHRKEYLETIDGRPEVEVRLLLWHFLVKSGTFPLDIYDYEGFIRAKEADPERYKTMSKMQYYQRLFLHYSGEADVTPWEGLTWVMDLLPRHPELAIKAVFGYFMAHAWHIGDSMIYRLNDAEEIIRAKYIGFPKSTQDSIVFLLNQGPRTFECLVERLYFYMGYETKLTKPQKDGGRDVLCQRNEAGTKEHLQVECKLYTKPVGVGFARALFGVVCSDKSNKGTLVTTNRFTSGAREFEQQNPRLELIDGESLIPLMNKHIGPRWSLQLERLIAEANRDLPAKRKDEDFS